MTTVENSELLTLRKVVERLGRSNIPYMLTGSMALNFYGQPRATNDFDIVIEVASDDQSRLLKVFEGDFYITDTAVRQALSQEGMFNVIDIENVFKVDLIIRKNNPFAAQQFGRRRIKEFGGLFLHVISPEDLILSKLDWSRESLSEMQGRDVKNLIAILSKDLDQAYLEVEAARLGVLERLKELTSHVST